MTQHGVNHIQRLVSDSSTQNFDWVILRDVNVSVRLKRLPFIRVENNDWDDTNGIS
jgi:hypothetical protein